MTNRTTRNLWRTRWSWLALIVAGAGFVTAPPVAAQQPAAAGARAASPLAREWKALRDRFATVEIEDARRAVAAYGEFYDRHFSGANASGEGELAIEIVTRSARLLALELGERPAGIKLLETAIGRWREPRLLAILQREYDQLTNPDDLMATPIAPPVVAPIERETEEALTAPQAETARIARIAPLLELLAAGQDGYLLWSSGQWNVDDLVWALEHGINSHGVVKGRSQQQGKVVREALARLLAGEGDERLRNEKWRALPLQTRLWLGDYYRQQKDERATPLLQSVVDDAQKMPDAANSRDLFFAAERLGWYWHAAGQHEQSALAWLRLETQPKERAYGFLQAARERDHAGNPAEAERLYQLALEGGHPQVTVAILLDRARELRAQNQLEEAAAALSGDAVETVPLVERLPLFSELSLVRYQQGQFAAAREAAQSALDGRAALSSTNTALNRALNAQQDPYLLQAKRTLEWSERWEKMPLQVLPAPVSARRGETVRLSVRSYARLPLQVEFESAPPRPDGADKKDAPNVLTTDKPTGALTMDKPMAGPPVKSAVEPAQATVQNATKITTARLRPDGWTGQRAFYFEQEVELRVETAGTLIISCPAPGASSLENNGAKPATKVPAATVAAGTSTTKTAARWQTRVTISIAP